MLVNQLVSNNKIKKRKQQFNKNDSKKAFGYSIETFRLQTPDSRIFPQITRIVLCGSQPTLPSAILILTQSCSSSRI